MIGLDRKGDRHAGTAVEKSGATLDTNTRYFASERRWKCLQKECPCEKHTRSSSHFDLKLKQRQIARSANLSQSTVLEYLRWVHGD
jgi:hypothetical protein